MSMNFEALHQLLSAPFPPERISWLPKTLARRDGKFAALALAYIDARDVMVRLDDACGPANWQDEYQETARGRVLCTLRIKIGKDWISKSDGSGESDIEAEKGGISGAFKRAAVKWGIGRYLYEIEAPWAECTVTSSSGGTVEFQSWTTRGQARLRAALAANGNMIAPSETVESNDLPNEIRNFITQLEQQITKGDGSKFWTDNFPYLPAEWRAFAQQEKERLKARATPRGKARTASKPDQQCAYGANGAEAPQ